MGSQREMPRRHVVLSKNPIDAVRRADSTLDARRVAPFVTAGSLCEASGSGGQPALVSAS